MEQAKLHWSKSMNHILGLPEIIDNFPKTLIQSRKRVKELFANFVEHWFQVVKHWKWDHFVRHFRALREPPTFGTGRFMSREGSFQILQQLFALNYVDPRAAFRNWVCWFDQGRNKQNTMLLIGPPNSLKTWYCQAWEYFALFSGRVSNPTRGESFPLGNITHCRLIFWDEANMGLEDSFADLMKMVLGGDEVPVAVKYQDKQRLHSAPVIMCANQHPCRIPSAREALNARWEEIEWNCTDEIRNLVKGGCHHLALIDMYEWAMEPELSDDELVALLLTQL